MPEPMLRPEPWWNDADMAQAYLAGYNAARAYAVPSLGPCQVELADIAEDFGHWLNEVHEPLVFDGQRTSDG